MSASLATVLRDADQLLPEFRAALEKMPPHERGRGIYASEMFFFYCLVRPLRPRQILESGRARGGSTLTLAYCFPETRIVSVEFDAASPNASIALEKLALHKNVECLFGDSRESLPKFLQPGDPVLIDGPKEFRAIKLALHLLRTGKPGVVFLHDFGTGSAARRFLERSWTGAFFSDNSAFLERFSWLDDHPEHPRDWRRPRQTAFACLPAGLPALSSVLLTKLILARTVSLAPSKVRGLFTKRATSA